MIEINEATTHVLDDADFISALTRLMAVNPVLILGHTSALARANTSENVDHQRRVAAVVETFLNSGPTVVEAMAIVVQLISYALPSMPEPRRAEAAMAMALSGLMTSDIRLAGAALLKAGIPLVEGVPLRPK